MTQTKKWPGGTAIPAEPRPSTIPPEGIAMDSLNDTISLAVAPAPLTLTVDPSALAILSPCELRIFGHALRTIHDVSNGLGCQPRFMGDDHNPSPAGNLLEYLNEGFGLIAEAVYQAAKALPAVTPYDVEEKAWCILETKASWGDGLEDIAVSAAEAVRDHHRAEFNATFNARRAA